MNELIKRLEERKQHLEKIKTLLKEKVVYIPYKIRPIEKKILSKFGRMSSAKLANEIRVNRSYVYAVIKKFENIYSSNEIEHNSKIKYNYFKDMSIKHIERILTNSSTKDEVRE